MQACDLGVTKAHAGNYTAAEGRSKLVGGFAKLSFGRKSSWKIAPSLKV